MRIGVATIYQELDLVDGLTVAENIFLGHEHSSGGFMRPATARAAARDLLGRLGHADIDPGRQRCELRCGERLAAGIGEQPFAVLGQFRGAAVPGKNRLADPLLPNRPRPVPAAVSDDPPWRSPPRFAPVRPLDPGRNMIAPGRFCQYPRPPVHASSQHQESPIHGSLRGFIEFRQQSCLPWRQRS